VGLSSPGRKGTERAGDRCPRWCAEVLVEGMAGFAFVQNGWDF